MRRKKKEDALDKFLDRELESRRHSGNASKSSASGVDRSWLPRHKRLVLSMAVLVTIGLGIMGLAYQNGLWFQNAGSRSSKAVLVDGLSISYQDPSFTNNVTRTLTAAGYQVDYIGPDRFTVDTFAKIASAGYGLVIIRSHTARSTIVTSELYSTSKYVFEQLAGSIAPATTGTSTEYFAVTSQYISQQVQGSFPNAIVVLMGCGDPNDRETFAVAFAARGASYLIGFDQSVSAQYTDSDTSILVSALAHGSSVEDSVRIASGQDPVYHGKFGYVSSASITQQRIDDFLSELGVFMLVGAIIVFGPLTVFLIPKLLARR